MQTFVVVGTGIAGFSAVSTLSQEAGDARIVWIGDEVEAPYDRPPLSKDFLTQDDVALARFSPETSPAKVEMHLGVRVTTIARDDRCLTTDDGNTIRYDRLLLATGSSPRPLPKTMNNSHVAHLRTAAHAVDLRRKFRSARHLVIVGGGYIGLEVAFSARARGCSVTMVEVGPSLLGRTGSAALGSWALRTLESNGVDVRLNTSIAALSGSADEKTTVHLSDNEGIVADVMLAAIGVLPNCQIATSAGLATDNGIVVDAFGRTNDPAIFAAGEATRYPIAKLGGSFRTESWNASRNQAIVAAKSMAGLPTEAFDELPWNWSDLGRHSVQCLGMPAMGTKRLTIGDAAGDEWMEIFLDARETLVGCVTVNQSREMSKLRRALVKESGIPAGLLQRANIRPTAC
ncbi:NAD(P)/FAD-dependent oxidoreductase [Tianweitania sp.]|uniref:NAD(P)/FAD-dependent oxidoreductase n=1 Tax=Tianweitania sp. TaxID=2021634 RepID=UPI00289AD53B|nr:FAD-dependent oxidoreductase [Tianweitania sp.]